MKLHCLSRLRATLRQDEGSTVIELALMLPILLLLLVGAIDFGQAYYVAIEVSSAAKAGALYGTQQPSDIAGMRAAALLDSPDVKNISASAIYGCECSDGSGQSASCSVVPSNCSANVVTYVQVSTNATYNSIIQVPGIPSAFPLSSQVRMRAAH